MRNRRVASVWPVAELDEPPATQSRLRCEGVPVCSGQRREREPERRTRVLAALQVRRDEPPQSPSSSTAAASSEQLALEARQPERLDERLQRRVRLKLGRDRRRRAVAVGLEQCARVRHLRDKGPRLLLGRGAYAGGAARVIGGGGLPGGHAGTSSAATRRSPPVAVRDARAGSRRRRRSTAAIVGTRRDRTEVERPACPTQP